MLVMAFDLTEQLITCLAVMANKSVFFNMYTCFSRLMNLDNEAVFFNFISSYRLKISKKCPSNFNESLYYYYIIILNFLFFLKLGISENIALRLV